jgi:hypothetical protein
MNNLQQSHNDLQIQIGEYLAGMMHKIDNKLDMMIQALANMENNITHINTRLNQLENSVYTPNKRTGKGVTFADDIEDNGCEIKRKISQARQEHEFKSLLEKEKIKWEREQQEREFLIEQAKLEWENDKNMKEEKINAEIFNYLN